MMQGDPLASLAQRDQEESLAGVVVQKLEDPLEDNDLYHVIHREVEEVAHRRHPPGHPDRYCRE